jgi:hypothetical protein
MNNKRNVYLLFILYSKHCVNEVDLGRSQMLPSIGLLGVIFFLIELRRLAKKCQSIEGGA